MTNQMFLEQPPSQTSCRFIFQITATQIRQKLLPLLHRMAVINVDLRCYNFQSIMFFSYCTVTRKHCDGGKDLQVSRLNQLKWTIVLFPQIHLSAQATLCVPV